MDSKLRILFIENQLFDMQSYIDLLKDRYNIELARDVLQARDIVENRLPSFSLVILDIMMAPMGLFTPAESTDGLLTGVCFFDRFLYQKPSVNAPVAVIVLTAASGDTLNTLHRLQRNNSNQIIKLLSKSDTRPWDLKDVVDEWAKNTK